MNVEALVRVIVQVELAVGIVMLLVIVVAALRARVDRRRRAIVRTVVQRAFEADLEGRPYAREDVDAIRGAAYRHVIAAVAHYGRTVSEVDRSSLRRIAELAGALAHANRRFRRRAWWQRLDSARLLTLLGASDDEIVAMLHDRHPLIRAQGTAAAAAWPFPGVDACIAALLHDNVETCRVAAREALLRRGSAARSVVLAELRELRPGGTSLDRAALLEVAAAMPSLEMVDVALRHSLAPEGLIRESAARLLGAIPDDAAISQLMFLLGDDLASVRRAAAHELGAAAVWRAAPALGDRLDDDAADVRLAAAAALQQLGPPGTIVLRHIERRGTPRAATIAHHSLVLIERLRDEAA